MTTVVQFSGPREVAIVDEPEQPLVAGHVRVRTWYSGISAGTELTAYRGSNPYQSKTWDPDRRIFVAGAPTFPYPSSGWGYQEVGQIIETADDVTGLAPGDVVYGIWGHRGEAVVPAAKLAGHQLPAGVRPMHAVFVRVGAVALNAVLAADLHVGEDVAVFGQGVIGLLTTRLSTLNGARVIAVDMLPARLHLSTSFGAALTVSADVPGGAGQAVRSATGINLGVDVAVEISGSYRALHEAIRSVQPGGRVVAAGFYQGEGHGLALGEEFHLNRVELIASQIGSVPRGLTARWDHERMLRVFMQLIADSAVDVAPLVTHVVDVADAAEAYTLLDRHPDQALQIVLSFPAAPGVVA
jgi:2-desacetyl-2-hydroxyethyl bacteriochlorophyllide A dehydrogenase